jgi:hypothetical protein
MPAQNPGRLLTEAVARGMKLIVIDPRRTQTARRAQIHLQPRPGEDAALLAAMMHVILAERLEDADFLREHVDGVEALRAAVAPFTPSVCSGASGRARRADRRGGTGLCAGATRRGGRGDGRQHVGSVDAGRVPDSLPEYVVWPLLA